jgi:hypothetical protein
VGRVALLGVVLLGSLGFAALAFVIVPPTVAPTAAVAVYAASLATAGFVISARTALFDRSDLRAEVTLEYWGPAKHNNRIIRVRFFNAGRRPVRVEEAGVWVDKSRATPFPSWNRGITKDDPLPQTLPEGDSHAIYAWPRLMAAWYVRHEPAAFLYAKPAIGKTRWWELPDDVRASLAGAWPEAVDEYRKETEAEAAEPGELDDYGHPVRTGEHGPE